MTADSAALFALRDRWLAAWPEALGHWSRFTKLTSPRWCFTADDEKEQGLSDSFAMIRLHDQAVVVSLARVLAAGVQDFPREVLAHEIGHHVYVPANLLDHGRMLARMRRGLPDRESFAPLIANLFADMLINDRLQRQAGLDMSGVYRELRTPGQAPLWKLIMRGYEVLWSLPRETLAEPPIEPALEADAGLVARVVRSFARDWLDGAGRFAVLCLSYLLKEKGCDLGILVRGAGGWCDTIRAGQGAGDVPAGLIDIDLDEARGIIHPMFDPELSGVDLGEKAADIIGHTKASDLRGGSPGQCREPFEYGQVLRALGLDMSDHDIAVRYYRERALPYLVPFPVKRMPRASDPLPEGLETWDFGQPLEQVDWIASVLTSPVVVPGVTTRQRTWGVSEGADPETRPIDLDLYVDCSGSMPNPQRVFSPIALAGAIIALSALRVGSGVQATLWSGAGQFETTGGFVRDPVRVLRILTGYLGGATAFPLHILRDTFSARKPTSRAVHLLVVSDDGVTTILDKDERGRPGREISIQALGQARGGGTMVLNLVQDWTKDPGLVQLHEQGWSIFVVKTLEDLVPFARQFSRSQYDREPSHDA
jgi:hypothetical protein